MDYLAFISNLTAALAWPIVVLIISFRYRPELRALVSGMKKLKVGPMEAEMFDESVRAVKDMAQALPLPAEKAPEFAIEGEFATRNVGRGSDEAASFDDTLLDLLSSNPGGPKGTIEKAWLVVEDSLRALAIRHGLDDEGASFMSVLNSLINAGHLSFQEGAVLRQMFDLRNQAVHNTISFSDDTALNFAVAASSVVHKVGRGSVRLSRTLGRAPISGTKVDITAAN